MTETLADVLSELEDPDAIRAILRATSTETDQSLSTQQDEASLSDQYERYLDRRRNRSPSTRAQYKRTIPHFLEFAEEHGIQRPGQLSTDIIDEYTDQLFEQYNADATIHTYTKNIRAWLRWLNKRGLCSESIFRILDKDELGLSPTARDEALPRSRAASLLEILTQRRYGTAMHALIELIWNAGPRLGEVHSLDVRDFDPDENDLHFRHRPENGTRLKNGSSDDDTSGDGERDLKIQPRVSDAIQQYVRTDRPDVTDEYNREPLFTTAQGRAHRSTLRRWVYQATSCQWLGNFDTEVTCDGSCCPDANVCALSYYPHAIRRGAIVNHLSGGLRPDRVSERFDVSVQIIEKHYDPRTKQQKKEDRAKAVQNAWFNINTGGNS